MEKTIHNVTTGEITNIQITIEEAEQINARAIKLKEETAKVIEVQAEADAAKAAAQAKLAALGLTTDDLKALGL